MELLSKAKTGKVERPVKVLQFGEGNFLRAFVDYMIDIARIIFTFLLFLAFPLLLKHQAMSGLTGVSGFLNGCQQKSVPVCLPV